MSTTRRISIFINGKQAQSTINDLYRKKRSLNKEINKMTIGTKEYEQAVAELAKTNKIIKEHRRRVAGIKSSWGKLQGSIVKYASVVGVAMGAREIVMYGKEVFDLAVKMEVLEKKAATVFGEALPAVTKAAEENAAALGLTTAQYRDNAAAIGDLLVPMGFQREEAAKISTGLVNLSGALSEWTGGQKSAKEVSDILSKAMLGEREQLKTLGIAISEADVKARLAAKGLSKLTGKAREQARAAATLELITEKSADAQAAFAENSDTLVRKQAEMSARFQDVKEELATALIPVFYRLAEEVLPLVSRFAQWVKSLISGTKESSRLSAVGRVLSTVFGNMWKIIKLVGGQVARLSSWLFDKLSPAFEFVGKGIALFYNGIVQTINGISSLIGSDFRLKPIDIKAFVASMKTAEVQADTSVKRIHQKLKATSISKGSQPPTSSGGRDAKHSAKRAKREEEQLIKRLDRLKQLVKNHNDQLYLQNLKDDERELERIRQKYRKEIEEAKKLEDSKNKEIAAAAREARQQLEQQMQQELEQKKIEQAAKREQEKLEAQQRIESETATEMEQLATKYQQLLDLADQYGFDSTELRAKWEKEKAAILDKAAKEEMEREEAQLQARLAIQSAQIGAMQEGVAAIKAIFKKNEAIQRAAFLLEKGLAAAQIVINLQSQISAIHRKYEAIPGGVALAAAEILKAKLSAFKSLSVIAATTIQKFIQKKEGGWHTVKGADDGTTYRARYIGRPSTGLLPGHPSLVLASERGPEYFVSHEDLQNPPIANFVRIIDRIKNGGAVPQYAEGGATQPLPAPVQPNTTDTATAAVLQRLANILDKGIIALVNDEQIIEIFRRYEALEDDAGGSLF